MSTSGDRRITELSELTGAELASRTVELHHALADRLGLIDTDLRCFYLICRSATPLTSANLAILTGLTGGAITGVVNRLAAAGFVRRVPDPNDKRRWELHPNHDRAREVDALFAPIAEAMGNEMFAEFLYQLGYVLDRLGEDPQP